MIQTQHYESAMEACLRCAAACDLCVAGCLQENDLQSMARCISLSMDCADLCRSFTSCMARDSDLCLQMADLCASACESCADECRRFSQDFCQSCTQACRRCAAECRSLLRVPAGTAQMQRGVEPGMSAH